MDIVMDLSPDLIDIQGILSNLATSSTEQLINIKYLGGNERKIKAIIKGINDYLVSKKYLINGKCNPTKKKEIKDIVLFLTINTDFSNRNCLNESIIHHLCNNTPKLSKCILGNTVSELDLAHAYSSVFAMLPLPLSAEMLPEIVACVKNCPPVTFRTQAFHYLHAIITKLGCADINSTENARYFKTIEEATMQILFCLSQFNVDQAEGFTKSKLYQHIGLIVFDLSKLMLCCQPGNDSLGRILDNLINSCCTIYRAVSLDVYVEWTEVDLDGESLQQKIVHEAYRVIEKYHKYKPAKELIEMFSTIAKKPPTLTEFIHLSSVETIVAKVNEIGESREKQEWFTAMLNTAVFDNVQVMTCLDKWYKMCTVDDVVRILDLSVQYDRDDVKKLAIKCAGGLETEDFNIAVIRYYRQHGLNKNLNLNTTSTDLTILMNKIHKSSSAPFINEILLLLLQNTRLFTEILLTECIKSSDMTQTLESTFSYIKNIILIENLSQICLEKCLETSQVTEENLENYIQLFDMLRRTECIRKEDEMLFSILKCQDENNLTSDVLLTLKIINALNISNCKSDITKLLLNILNKSRCQFFDFCQRQIDICKEVIFALNKNLNKDKSDVDKVSVEGQTLTAKLNLYYANLEENKKVELLDYLYPKFNLKNYSEGVSKILKILPSCVLEEWLNISNSIEKSYGIDSFLEILTDTLLLICQVANSVKTNADEVRAGLQYCLTNYGIVIQKTILHEDHIQNLQLQQKLVRKICLLITQILPKIRETEGFKLLGLLTSNVIKSMKSDSNFINLVNSIDNVKLSEAIANKMQ